MFALISIYIGVSNIVAGDCVHALHSTLTVFMITLIVFSIYNRNLISSHFLNVFLVEPTALAAAAHFNSSAHIISVCMCSEGINPLFSLFPFVTVFDLLVPSSILFVSFPPSASQHRMTPSQLPAFLSFICLPVIPSFCLVFPGPLVPLCFLLKVYIKWCRHCTNYLKSKAACLKIIFVFLNYRLGMWWNF